MILFNNREIKFGKFPNGESNLDKSFLKDKEDIKNVVTLKYENDEDIFHLWMVRNLIDFPTTLRITYVPYSRMDRASEKYAFTLLDFADLVNRMLWEEVIIYEPHSDVTPALFDNVKVVNVIPWLMGQINHPNYQVFFPDAGAQKRYETLFDTSTELGKWRADNTLVGFKKRDFNTGKIKELKILGERYSDTVIIVDDLCSKGGTFILAAKKLKEMGFLRIALVVAHCEWTIFSGEIFEPRVVTLHDNGEPLIELVVTTDSILDMHSQIENDQLEIHSLGNIR